jgi:hypothetical protein
MPISTFYEMLKVEIDKIEKKTAHLESQIIN